MTDDPDALAAEMDSVAAQARRQMTRMVGMHELSRRLFYGPDGALTDAAIEWLDWLGKRTFVSDSAYDPDARAHAFNEGRRTVALEIFDGLRLDARRLANLKQQLREEDDE